MYKNNRLDYDLKIINDRLIKDIPAIISIVLVGGYGRDEGSWIYDEKNNEYLPYNDYDIVVVTSQKGLSVDIEKIRKELANLVGIKWVDITLKDKDELKTLGATIYNYDLKYVSKIIYGQQDILDLIPCFKKSDISLWDVEALFFTRLWTFLGCMDIRGFNRESFQNEDARFFKNQMAKAILATLDAMLINTSNYEPLYKEKLRRAIELFPGKEWIKALGTWALNEKLNPSNQSLDILEAKNLYTHIHEIYMNEFSSILKRYYILNLGLPYSIKLNMYIKPYYVFRRIGNIILRRNLNYEKYITINLAQAYIFCAYKRNGINKTLLKRTVKLIRPFSGEIGSEVSWNELRILVSKLRNGDELD